jgi:hypothetical protein
MASQIVSVLKGRGWSDAAIHGALANALAEGGLSEPWKQSSAVSNGQREESYGPWQFHKGGELDGYTKYVQQNKIKDPKDINAQTNYMADRVEKMLPGYQYSDNSHKAIDRFHIGFERPANKTPGTRYQHLDSAMSIYNQAQKDLSTQQNTQTAQPGSPTQGGNPPTTAQNQQQGPIPGSRFSISGDASRINPVLLNTLHAASSYLPDGYSVRMTSGYRDPERNKRVGGAQGSHHTSGNAVDVQIVDPKGNILANKNAGPDSPYGTLARAGYHVLQKTNPELASKWGWGGNFMYHGFADSMHYDLGGDRGSLGKVAQQYKQYQTADNFKPYVAPGQAGQTQLANKTPTTPPAPTPVTTPQQVAQAQPVPSQTTPPDQLARQQATAAAASNIVNGNGGAIDSVKSNVVPTPVPTPPAQMAQTTLPPSLPPTTTSVPLGSTPPPLPLLPSEKVIQTSGARKEIRHGSTRLTERRQRTAISLLRGV